jgi:hypothetical protein
MLALRRENVRVAGQRPAAVSWNRSARAPGRSPGGCAGNASRRSSKVAARRSDQCSSASSRTDAN